MKHLVSVLLAFLWACNPPSQNNPDVYGAYQVAFDQSLDGITDWRADQQQYMDKAIEQLNALGPNYTRVDPGAPVVDLVVRTFDSGPGCAHGSGRFSPGLHYVEVDPACAAGYLELQQAIAHEVMHWTTYTKWGWVGHICVNVADATDCHHVIFGDAVLNPGLSMSSAGDVTLEELWAPSSGEGIPTANDLELFSRCLGQGCP